MILPAHRQQFAKRVWRVRAPVGQEPGDQFGQMENLPPGTPRLGHRPDHFGIEIPLDGFDQRLGQFPVREEPGGKCRVVEAHRFGFHRDQVLAVGVGFFQQSRVRLAQLLDQQQLGQVLEQPGDKGVVARLVPNPLADFASGDGLGQRVPPVVLEDFAVDPGKQARRQAESQDQQLQRLGPEQGERLVQVGYFAREPEQRTVHYSQELRGQGGIVLDARLQGAGVDVGVAGQLEHFHGHGRQAVEPFSLGDKVIDDGVRAAHGRACNSATFRYADEVLQRCVPSHVGLWVARASCPCFCHSTGETPVPPR